MKSLPSTASIEPRVMRASGANEKIAIEIAGSASWRSAPQNTSMLPVRAERVAEIAVQKIADIGHELLGQRLVEPELGADLGDRLRGRGKAGEIGRRIARQQARQHEGDDDHPDNARDRRCEA